MAVAQNVSMRWKFSRPIAKVRKGQPRRTRYMISGLAAEGRVKFANVTERIPNALQTLQASKGISRSARTTARTVPNNAGPVSNAITGSSK